MHPIKYCALCTNEVAAPYLAGACIHHTTVKHYKQPTPSSISSSTTACQPGRWWPRTNCDSRNTPSRDRQLPPTPRWPAANQRQPRWHDERCSSGGRQLPSALFRRWPRVVDGEPPPPPPMEPRLAMARTSGVVWGLDTVVGKLLFL